MQENREQDVRKQDEAHTNEESTGTVRATIEDGREATAEVLEEGGHAVYV